MHTLNEPVNIVAYDANWSTYFQLEQTRLIAGLDVSTEQIVHIGSTAVPNLVAKPIIDMMLGVATWPPSELVMKRIVELGYEALGEAGVNGRLYFRLRSDVSFNLHVVLIMGPHWLANLALRDYLRRNTDARTRYAAAKQNAITSGATDLLSYSKHKSDSIAQLLEEALQFQDTHHGN